MGTTTRGRRRRGHRSIGSVRLQRWKLRHKFLNTTIADLFGVHFSLISYFLTGRRTPSARLALKIQQIAGIAMVDWLTPSTEPVARTRSNGR